VLTEEGDPPPGRAAADQATLPAATTISRPTTPRLRQEPERTPLPIERTGRVYGTPRAGSRSAPVADRLRLGGGDLTLRCPHPYPSTRMATAPLGNATRSDSAKSVAAVVAARAEKLR
jgi:hypothetical protein